MQLLPLRQTPRTMSMLIGCVRMAWRRGLTTPKSHPSSLEGERLLPPRLWAGTPSVRPIGPSHRNGHARAARSCRLKVATEGTACARPSPGPVVVIVSGIGQHSVRNGGEVVVIVRVRAGVSLDCLLAVGPAYTTDVWCGWMAPWMHVHVRYLYVLYLNLSTET